MDYMQGPPREPEPQFQPDPRDNVGSILGSTREREREREWAEEGSQRSRHNRYKDAEDYYVDTYEAEKKRQNQNYSNLMGTKLGDKDYMGEHQDPEEYSKNTLELNVNQREQVQESGPRQKLLPSVHYSEFKNSGYFQEPPKPKSDLDLVDERMRRMKKALQNNPPTPSHKTISESAQSQGGRNFYRHAMGHGQNPINNTENKDIFGKTLNEHEGDVVVRDYKLQGYKYTLMKKTDREIQAEFLKNGYHIINLEIVRDPISGDANGKVNLKVRLVADHERLFEHFLKTTMDFVVLGKR